ncbi:hypothetical protein PMIN06_010646 [Paraphaeosphaeria minitans]
MVDRSTAAVTGGCLVLHVLGRGLGLLIDEVAGYNGGGVDKPTAAVAGGDRIYISIKVSQHGFYTPLRLLSRQIAVLDPSQSSQTSDHSAGWLILDEASPCKPVLIAPSLLSAFSLIRSILPFDTLRDDAWQSLVAAAQHLAADPDDLDEDPSSVPPSAQKPPAKRKLSQPSTSPVAKRVRPSGRASRRLSSPQTALCVSHAQRSAPSPL